MTERSTTEHELRVWLETTGRLPLPTDVDDLLARTAATRQRPAWTFPERWLPVNIAIGQPTIAGRRTSLRAIGLVALLLITLLVGAVFVAGSRRPVPPPFGLAANGQLVYVRPADGTGAVVDGVYRMPFGDIVLVDPSTGVQTELVGGPASDGSPAISLDGTRLAFVRDGTAGKVLYVVDTAGGDPVALGDAFPDIRDPAWSPDGSKIAFAAPDGARWRLWIVSTDGGRAVMVPTGDIVSAAVPQWRPPMGDELLFLGASTGELLSPGGYRDFWGNDEPGQDASSIGLYLVRPDGTDLRPVTPATGSGGDYSHTAWTADGTRILTQVHGPYGYMRVEALDPDGTVRQTFCPVVGLETLAPLLSPDGRSVAYADLGAGDHWTLRVARLGESGPPVGVAEFDGGAASYAWSPDGRTIVVTHHYFRETWLVDIANKTKTKATWFDSGNPAWQRLAS